MSLPLLIVILLASLGVAGTVPLVLSLRRGARRDEARGRELDEGCRSTGKLEPGMVMLRGEVQHAPDSSVAVRVEFELQGTEMEDSGGWETSWYEAERRIEAAPFYLRRDDGQRVRVEPTERVQLVDHITSSTRIALDRRLDVAELTPGESLFAYGRLSRESGGRPGQGGYAGQGGGQGGGGYRQASTEWVLRGEPLMLSTEPFGDRLRALASRKRLWSWLLAVGGAVVHSLLLPLHLQLFGLIESEQPLEHKLYAALIVVALLLGPVAWYFGSYIGLAGWHRGDKVHDGRSGKLAEDYDSPETSVSNPLSSGQAGQGGG